MSTEVEVLYIVGAGGSGREVAWLAGAALPRASLTFVVDRPEFLSAPVDGIQVRLLHDLPAGTGRPFVVAIGEPGARRAVADSCVAHGLRPVTLVHPGVDRTGRNSIGDGSVVCAGAVLTTGVTLGRHVHVNVQASISHDCVVGDFVTVSPGVHVSGHVRIGAGAFLGTGACVVNGSASQPLVIGEGSVVAAGACVTRDVEPGAVVAGVPAVRKR